ncbi:MAG: EamA family transporter [Anaerolineales bacterium]|nr:EamA family transporter [Anaerolineales bacterium]
MNLPHIYPMLQALLAALLFGASAPLAKMLLGEMEPVSLAAFLYLGSGIGLLIVKAIAHISGQSGETEARLKKTDSVWLAGAVIAGGVAAPIVLLFSLQHTPAATTSLLLNFESVSTTLIAAYVFKEAISRRTWWAILSITFASILLTVNFNTGWGISIGALGVLAACVLWGIDNNLTRHISAKDPLMIVTIKGLGAGLFSLILARILGEPFPIPVVLIKALLVGSLCYGMSIFFFIHAMRGLGAARTSALFATAPLAGVALSVFLFKEIPGAWFAAALLLMAAGTVLLLGEKHAHLHIHEEYSHEHRHEHADGHHPHQHAVDSRQSRSHSHDHSHCRTEHKHHHLPDIHHRHEHVTETYN